MSLEENVNHCFKHYVALKDALEGLAFVPGKCWCGKGLFVDALKKHDPWCKKARRVLEAIARSSEETEND